MVKFLKIGLCQAVLLLCACTAIKPLPGADSIVMSRDQAPKECERLGEVVGSQGNFLTADFTPDREMILGARNDLRNQALALGGNYVTIDSENYSAAADDSLGGTHSAVLVGNVYRCPRTPDAIP